LTYTFTVSRGILLGFLVALFAVARAQTSAPAKTANRPRLTAHDSVTVSAGIPPDVLRKEAEYDKVFQAAMELKEDDEYEDALAKFQSAEKIAETLPGPSDGLVTSTLKEGPLTLGDMRNGALQGVLEQEADILILLKRFAEAEKIFLHRMDILRAWAGEFDNAFAHNYVEAAAVHMIQQDWPESEQYCLQGMKAYDKAIDHFTATSDTPRLSGARRAKALDMYYLGLIYYRERKYVESLETLDQAFSTAAELHARRESLLPMATSARNIAIETLHWVEASKWESRLQSLPEEEPKGVAKH
jgi:tetratricopeptide (TPR) repeat protein